VRGDGPFSATFADAGEHDCDSNRWGAISVRATNGQMLGVKPAEFDVVAWRSNHWMNAKVRPARACQPRPPETTTAEELVWLANHRMKRFIAERHQFELDQVNAEFDQAAYRAAARTSMAQIEAMRRQGRSWIVKPFVRYRT
jgi:hypothetical protein